MLHGLKAVDPFTLLVRAQNELIIRYKRTWQNLVKSGHQFCMKVIDLAAKWLLHGISKKEMPVYDF